MPKMRGVRHFPNKPMRFRNLQISGKISGFNAGAVVVRFADHVHAICICAVTVLYYIASY